MHLRLSLKQPHLGYQIINSLLGLLQQRSQLILLLLILLLAIGYDLFEQLKLALKGKHGTLNLNCQVFFQSIVNTAVRKFNVYAIS